MSESLEYILACQIYLEDFEESGDHVPRILPCSHSLCEKCLKQLVQADFVECPECRKKHRVVNDVKTFPQNKYILANIRRKQKEIVKNEQKSNPDNNIINMCERHGKELNLYCKVPECQKPICQTCLTRNHRGHDVVEIEETEREALIEKFNFITKGLKERKEKILETTTNAKRANMECVQNITARKEKVIEMINQLFEEMLAKVKEKVQNDFTEKLTIIKEQSDVLKTIQHMDQEVITHQEIEADMNTVEQSIKDHLSGIWECKMVKLREQEPLSSDVERLCGHLEESTKYLDMNGYEWKVVHSLWTGMTNMCFLAPIDGNCVVILDDSFTKLVKYKWGFRYRIEEVQLDNEARHIVVIELAGHPCLAVTYKEQPRIEFRDGKDLNTVVLDHSVEPHNLPMMCASSNGSLWYEYINVHLVDCSSSPCAIPVQLYCGDTVYDMCCSKVEDTPLLVVACGYRGVKAYNITTEEMAWGIFGRIPLNDKCPYYTRSITTDDHDRLFVLDEQNKCVHIFSVMGKYVTTLRRKGERGIGEVRKIRWSEGMSGLIVVHGKGRNTKISLIKIQS